ncbi:MAG: DPP IV N-terminal domain-containing protein [Phycisphaerae bacterium]|nr:DPP IV N-terminal domain-containing protein [Phycisphaerae bacterium]
MIRVRPPWSFCGVLLASLVLSVAHAQWVPYAQLPGAAKVRAVQQKTSTMERGGRVRDVRWDTEQREAIVRVGDTWTVYPIAGGEPRVLDDEPAIESEREQPAGRRRPGPARGRQHASADSPDGTYEARYRDGNLYLKSEDADEKALTTEGDGKLKFGSASWVYGEELDQSTAMWWSPDSSKLAFYRFDDRNVNDFHLVSGWTKLNTAIMSEAYPKPGQPNPIAGLMVYDVKSDTTVTVDVGASIEQYIYEVAWTPDSRGLLFRRTNRRQNVLDLMVADPATGASRVVLSETQPNWQKNSPEFRFLRDGERFVWESESTGFAQYQLWSLANGKICDLTKGEFPVSSLVRIDEGNGDVWYVARSSETKINPQLHRAKLDGSGDVRLTPDDLHWSSFRVAPDGTAFVATCEFVDRPPSTHLFRMEGSAAVKVATLAEAERDPWTNAGVQKPEFLRVKAADGTTELYGVLSKPSDFDPSKKYPLVVSAYGGPAFAMVSSRMQSARPECEFGVLMVTLDNRGTPGRGKVFEDANYLSLGEEDCDDQAALVRQLAERPYVDKDRVAITGHSYGGYMTIIAMLRYPEVFAVGVAGAPPTDWRNYDTIYTERYMRTPEENEAGYDGFSCVKLAKELKGKLLLLHGMVDDNVHPNNTWQLVQELQTHDIPFEMMLFPNSGHGIHSPASDSVKWSYLLRHLGLHEDEHETGAAP